MTFGGTKLRLEQTIPISLLLSLAFVVLFGGSDVIASMSHARHVVSFPFELNIPFLAASAPVYLSVQLLFLSLLAIFPDAQALKPVAWTFLFQMVTASIVFVAYPMEVAFPPLPPTGMWAPLVRLADTLNLDFNLAPSLHVSLAFSAAEMAATKLSSVAGCCYRLWAAAIAVSTLVLHQHHVIDVLMGMFLAYVSTKAVYHSMRPV